MKFFLSLLVLSSSLYAVEVCTVHSKTKTFGEDNDWPTGQSNQQCAECTDQKISWCTEIVNTDYQAETSMLDIRQRNAVYKYLFEKGYDMKTEYVFVKMK